MNVFYYCLCEIIPTISDPSTFPSSNPSKNPTSSQPSAKPLTSSPSFTPSNSIPTAVPSHGPSHTPSDSMPTHSPSTSTPSAFPTPSGAQWRWLDKCEQHLVSLFGVFMIASCADDILSISLYADSSCGNSVSIFFHF